MSVRLGAVVGIVGLGLLLVSLAGPWWGISWFVDFLGQQATATGSYGLFGGTRVIVGPAGGSTEPISYSALPNIGGVFIVTLGLTVASIALAAVFILLALTSAGKPANLKKATYLAVAAFLVGVAAAAYVTFALPGAYNADVVPSGSPSTLSGFWGGGATWVTGFIVSATWAAGWAWWLALVAPVLFVLTSIIFYRELHAPAPAASSPGTG